MRESLTRAEAHAVDHGVHGPVHVLVLVDLYKGPRLLKQAAAHDHEVARAKPLHVGLLDRAVLGPFLPDAGNCCARQGAGWPGHGPPLLELNTCRATAAWDQGVK